MVLVAELPSAFQEVRATEQKLNLTQDDLPWISYYGEQVPLAQVNLKGGGEFFLGSAIDEKKLVRAADDLDKHRSEITNNLLYSHLPDFVTYGHHPYIRVVDNARTVRPIYYVGNKSGQRVYFMRFDRLQGIPVIIRVAVCDKNMEGEVLGVITTASQKRIKKASKL